MTKTHSVLNCLPDDEQIVRAYGYKTYCCTSDMEMDPRWHMAKFRLHVESFSLKGEYPKDLEESILATYSMHEQWLVEDDAHLIGITHWEPLPELPKKGNE